jgi:midasin (ATPase involved in ribosome maturation)
LQDQVRIHKWDEQTYYALKASAEKSHAVLHKLVCEYDEVLNSDAAVTFDAAMSCVAAVEVPRVSAAHFTQPRPFISLPRKLL